jgi:hypothetical protein
MTIKLLKASELNDKIGRVAVLVKDFTNAFNAGGLIHETACECLLHINKHGDVTPAQKLYEACGGIVNRSLRSGTDRKTLVKAEAVAMWFLQMSGKQITVRDNTWALVPKWNRTDEFWKPLLEAAESTPIMEYAQEERNVIRPIYAGQALSFLDNFIDKVKQNIDLNIEGDEKPHFLGDPDTTLAVLEETRDFMKKRFEQEDARKLGMAKEGNVTVFKPRAQAEAENQGNQAGNENTLIRDGEVVKNEQPNQNEEVAPQAAVA